MRLLCLFLAMVLLTGCAPSQPAAQSMHAAAIPPTTEAAIQPPTTEPPDPILKLLDTMSTEQKVGQLFLARYPGDAALQDLKDLYLGGFILFAEDFEGQTPESIDEVLDGLQRSSPIPLLIAVDEEGGSVCRVSQHSAFRKAPFPSPRQLYQQGGMELVLGTEAEKAFFLSSLGINVNMSPVCDIATSPGTFMYSRSLGLSPGATAEFAVGTMELMKAFQVGAVLKHFPGYGSNVDTHSGVAIDRRSLADLEAQDLIPFAAAIQAGCDAIMVSHIVVTSMDTDLPASLSPAVHSYLRSILGFDGVIVTDDLVMDAIREDYGTGEAAVLAVLAGNDLLCSTEYAAQYAAVLEAVESGRIGAAQLDRSVERILRWKQSLNLLT